MAYAQRYTEENEDRFEVDEQLLECLRDFHRDYSLEIAEMLDINASCLPEKNRRVQKIGGVIKFDQPLFFEVEYLKQIGEIPIYISLKEIDVDEYLDYINLNQILTYECI
jgi:hypothetical protein